MADTKATANEPQFWLEVVAGPQRRAEFPLREGDLVVGRSTRCYLTLPNAAVAPTHCGLRVRADRVVIAPGGTIAATYVNGERLTAEQLLRVGDRISIGPYDLMLRVRL